MRIGKVNAFEVLKERGFVHQCSDATGLKKAFAKGRVTFYAGFDPTAESLHVGHLVTIMAMAHLQRAGHRPIVIIGGGTALVGDPSGRTALREMLSPKIVRSNGKRLAAQLRRYVSLSLKKGLAPPPGGVAGLVVDNADWLLELRYVEFLRDVGRHFKVNEMMKAEAYRQRLAREEGLSFLEFNYQLLQAYDFLELATRQGCLLQLGGADQWGNIVAGVDLVRRVTRREVFGMTVPLLTTAGGRKMGKTADSAVWLDLQHTSPYAFYQFWLNTDDRDVEKFLLFFTFLSLQDIKKLCALKGEALRGVKRVLAFQVTGLAHGEKAAQRARAAAAAAFSGRGGNAGGPARASSLPTTVVSRARLSRGIPLVDLFAETGLAVSKSEARRLIRQGGAYLNDQPISAVDARVTEQSFREGSLLLRHGKKTYHRVVVKDHQA